MTYKFMEDEEAHQAAVAAATGPEGAAHTKLRRDMKNFQDAQQANMTKKEKRVWSAANDIVSRLQQQQQERPACRLLHTGAPANGHYLLAGGPAEHGSAATVENPELDNSRKVKFESLVSAICRGALPGMMKDAADAHSKAWKVLSSLQEHPMVVEKARTAYKQLESGNVSQQILADAFGWPSHGSDAKCKKEMDRAGITNAMAEYVFGDRWHNFRYVLNNLQQDKAALNFSLAVFTAAYMGSQSPDVKTVAVPVHLAKALLAFFCGCKVNWASVAWKLYTKRKGKCVFRPMWIPRLFKAWNQGDRARTFQTLTTALDVLHLCPAAPPSAAAHADFREPKRRKGNGGLRLPRGWEDAGEEADIRAVIETFRRKPPSTTNFFLDPEGVDEQKRAAS